MWEVVLITPSFALEVLVILSDRLDLDRQSAHLVRALAVTMVFLHHYPPPEAVVGHFLNSFFREMHCGVTLFFVLSGFLIYLRHSGPDALRRGPLIRYALNRFARIYPVYFLVVVGTLFWTLVALAPHRVPLGMIQQYLVLQLTFLRGFSNYYKFMGVGQGWSLTVEVTFYILFPLLLLTVRRFGFLLALVMTWAAGLLLYGFGHWLGRYAIFDPFQFVLIYTFFGRAGDFFAGMMLADYLRRRKAVHVPVSTGLQSEWRLPLFTILGGLGIAGCLSALGLLEPSATQDGPFNTLGGAVLILALPPCFCAILYGLIVERTWFSRMLGSRVAVMMGASSYCFYLIHLGGPHYVIGQWVRDCGLFPSYVALFVISIFLWAFVEEPLRKLILGKPLFQRLLPNPLPSPQPAI
jgi:peptidoglycan/LPS O-acetylase OafA/YrhL